MRIILAFAVLWLSACGGEPGAPDGAAALRISVNNVEAARNAADATFLDLDGKPLEIADFAGQRVFLNYWATWCAPCIREIPSILRAADALADEGYLFLFASDESIAEIQDFLGDYGFDGNFIKLNGFFGSMGVQAVPSSVLYGEDGEILKSWLGEEEWDSPALLSQLRNP